MNTKTWKEIYAEIETILGDKATNDIVKEAISRLSDTYVLGDVRECMREHYDDILKKYVVEPLKREKVEDTIIEKIIGIVRPWALKIIEQSFESDYKWYRNGYVGYQAIIDRKKKGVDNKIFFKEDEPRKIKCAREVYDWHVRTCEAMGIEKPAIPDWLTELSDLLARYPPVENTATTTSTIENEVEWDTCKEQKAEKSCQGTIESFSILSS